MPKNPTKFRKNSKPNDMTTVKIRRRIYNQLIDLRLKNLEPITDVIERFLPKEVPASIELAPKKVRGK